MYENSYPYRTRRPMRRSSGRNFTSRTAPWRSEPMTETQAGKIVKELNRREIAAEYRAELLTAVNNGVTRDGQPATKGSASDLIDWLMAKPFTGKSEGYAARTPQAERNTVKVTQEGFYLFDGAAYRVQKTKDGQRLYAKKATKGGWDYESAKGVIFVLTPEMLMTAADIAKFGIDSGFCIVCSTKFERLDSERLGIGPKCGVDVMGKEGYKQAMADLVARDPEVAEFVAMKRDEAKAKRDAKKAAPQADSFDDRYWDAQIQAREAAEDRAVAEFKMNRDAAALGIRELDL